MPMYLFSMKRYIFLIMFVISGLALFSQEVLYDDDLKYAQVIHVDLKERSVGKWSFDVTLTHHDTGWDHYADLWEIIDPETDEVLGTRVLAHPHVNEQPFTRSLSNITIDESVRLLEVRAKCTLHDYSGKSVLIDMDKPVGKDYNISFLY